MLIEEYKASWIKDFSEIREVLDKTLRGLILSIEHIGSTSIPNLAAKPIIDIDIVINNYRSFDAVKSQLESVGYFHAGDQGITNREVFKRAKIFNHNTLDSITHHLYVCPIDSEELKRHLIFRDFLQTNADARIEYQNLKFQIAEEANQDRKKYAELKELKAKEFINSVIEKARNCPNNLC
jgi:GrpB-like predicted nucleotidyltransferase (UPF0157 family)